MKHSLAVIRGPSRVFRAGLVLSLLLHVGLLASYMLSDDGPEEEVYSVRFEWDDDDTPFVLPAPRLTRDFAFRKQAVTESAPALRAQTDRTTTVVAGGLPGPRSGGLPGSSRRWSTTGGSQDFVVAVGNDGIGDLVVGMPQFDAVELASLKEPEQRIDMQAEFLDLSAIDTGKYRGMVIQDPDDKRNVSGFVYLGLAWGSILEPSRKRSVSQLVRAINDYTRIQARVIDQMFIDSQDLFKAPFVYITANQPFELTTNEITSLEKYLRNGGFLVADNDAPTLEYGPAEASLRDMLRRALGRDARFVPIPNDHPIYHVFFDFDDGPPPGGEAGAFTGNSIRRPVYFLEGIFLGDRLVAIYSDKGYGRFWEQESENEPHLKLGVNMVVFALTQKGSIAQQQIDFFDQASK